MDFARAIRRRFWHHYGNIRNGARMRPTEFSADTIVALLRKQTIASLPAVMAALGTARQTHRVSQAEGRRRPHQLFASRRLLHPRSLLSHRL